MHNQLYLLALGPAASSSSELSLPEGLDSEKRKKNRTGIVIFNIPLFEVSSE